jgi:hypothetical protein
MRIDATFAVCWFFVDSSNCRRLVFVFIPQEVHMFGNREAWISVAVILLGIATPPMRGAHAAVVVSPGNPLTLFPATVSLNVYGTGITGAGSSSFGTISFGSLGSATASGGFVDPGVSVSANAGGPPIGLFTATADAQLTYYMEIVDPIATSAKVLITATGTAAASDSFWTQSYAAMDFNGLPILYSGAGAVSGPASSSISGPYLAPANVPIRIDLQAYAAATIMNGYPTSDNATSTLDPMISIDPTDPSAGDATIYFSENLSVPEPSALTVIATPILGLAVLVRRRRRTASATPQ